MSQVLNTEYCHLFLNHLDLLLLLFNFCGQLFFVFNQFSSLLDRVPLLPFLRLGTVINTSLRLSVELQRSNTKTTVKKGRTKTGERGGNLRNLPSFYFAVAFHFAPPNKAAFQILIHF